MGDRWYYLTILYSIGSRRARDGLTENDARGFYSLTYGRNAYDGFATRHSVRNCVGVVRGRPLVISDTFHNRVLQLSPHAPEWTGGGTT